MEIRGWVRWQDQGSEKARVRGPRETDWLLLHWTAVRKGERRARTAEPSPHGAEQTKPVPSSTAAAGRSLQLPTASSKAEIPWSSTVDGPTASLLDLTQSQPQRHTPALGESWVWGQSTGFYPGETPSPPRGDSHPAQPWEAPRSESRSAVPGVEET